MASQEQFLPYLTDDQGRSLVKEGGTVVKRPLPTPQEHSPQGWEQNTIEFSRNIEFWGVVKAYITNLKFFSDSAFILRDWVYRFGTEVVIFFIWLKLDQNFGGELKHRGWYKGEVDFSTMKDEYDGVEVNITEGGFYKDLNANKAKPYGYKFDEDKTVSLEMDGMDIYYSAKFFVSNGLDIVDPNYNIGNHLVDLSTISNEFGTVGGVGPVTRYKPADGNAATIKATGKWFLQATSAGAVDIDYKFTITNTFYTPPALNPAAEFSIVVRQINTAGVDVGLHQLIHIAGAGLIGKHDVIGNMTINLSIGDELFLYTFVSPTGATGSSQTQFDYSGDDSHFNVSYKFRKPLTVTSGGFTAYDLGNLLVGSMGKSNNSLTSTVPELDTILCISGDGIRGIQNAGIQTTFTDWFKSVNSLRCLALDVINNNPVISSRYDKFNASNIASLGECSSFVNTPATSYMYSGVESGYPPASIDDVNGKYSFMNTYVWGTPYTRINNVYDCKSIYQADPFVIEITRINLEGKDTTDNILDNNIFFLDCEKVYADFTGDIEFLATQQITLTGITGLALKPGTRFRVTNGNNMGGFTVVAAAELAGNTVIQVAETVTTESINTIIEFRHFKLRRLPYTTIAGIPNSDTVFNMELSPKRSLQNHYRWLRSSFELMDAKYLTFQKTDMNADVVTTDAAGNVIAESADVLIGSMGERVFKPWTFTFEVESPYNLRDQMISNHDGNFDFTTGGKALKGFPIDIKTDDSMLTTQQYVLLATADSDLTQLPKNR